MADAPDLGSGAARRMSSSLFARTFSFFPPRRTCAGYAVVAQLVERHLAKVEVAGPSPVYRSIFICGCSSMVEPQPSKLITWVRFPSPALFVPQKWPASHSGRLLTLGWCRRARRSSDSRTKIGEPLRGDSTGQFSCDFVRNRFLTRTNGRETACRSINRVSALPRQSGSATLSTR